MVAAIGIVHRVALFALYRADLDAHVAANPDWYGFHNLPPPLLRDHLATALLYLQITPPTSNVLYGLAMKLFAWPDGVVRALVLFQGAVSVATATLFTWLLARLFPARPLVWIVAGALFVLGTDLVVLEYNSLGQTMYGPVTMLLVLAFVTTLVELRRAGRTRAAVVAGLTTGLLALTRSSFSYFAPPALVLVALAAPARRRRMLVAAALPIVLLQGGWALKNWAVWGIFSPATSSLGGLHLVASLSAAGLLKDAVARDDPDGTKRAQMRGWVVPPPPEDTSPLAARQRAAHARDAEVDRALGMPNPLGNRLAFRLYVAEGVGGWLQVARAQPWAIADKFRRAYAVFWQPIANYGRQWVALFSVGNRLTDPFDLPGIASAYAAGRLPDSAYVARGGFKTGRRWQPATLGTTTWIEPILLAANVVGVHILWPLTFLLWLAGRRPAPLRAIFLVVAAGTYGYLAVLANLVEMAENMRYRAEVEPMLWAVTLVCADEVWRALRSRVGRAAPAETAVDATAA